jgi:hypothetical protein
MAEVNRSEAPALFRDVNFCTVISKTLGEAEASRVSLDTDVTILLFLC